MLTEVKGRIHKIRYSEKNKKIFLKKDRTYEAKEYKLK
jgi:hypothetical protein